MLDGRVARLSKHQQPVRRRARLAGGRRSRSAWRRRSHVFPGVPGRGAVRLGRLLHLRGRGGAPAGAIQRAGPAASRPGWFTGPAVARGRHDAGHLLPVQPDRVVPARRSRTSISSTRGWWSSCCCSRVLMVSNGEVPQVPADRLPQRPRHRRRWSCSCVIIGGAHPGPDVVPVPLLPRLRGVRHRARGLAWA